jgi:phosphopantothenoylcysteine decarboxylase/phosphopantothenate--cysteine ligase
VSNSAIGFNSDNNAMTLYWVGGERHLSLQSKQQISHLILKEIASKLT